MVYGLTVEPAHEGSAEIDLATFVNIDLHSEAQAAEPQLPHQSILFEEEEPGPAPIPREAWDELVAPPGAKDEPLVKKPYGFMSPEAIQAYYRAELPYLEEVPHRDSFQQTGNPWAQFCPFDCCLGSIFVNPTEGYFQVIDGCGEQGSAYGYAMRVEGLSFHEVFKRVNREPDFPPWV
jgi:hypothetical protein